MSLFYLDLVNWDRKASEKNVGNSYLRQLISKIISFYKIVFSCSLFYNLFAVWVFCLRGHQSTRTTISVAAMKLNPSSPPLKLTDTYFEMQPPLNLCDSSGKPMLQLYVCHSRCIRTKGHSTPHISLTFPLQSVTTAVVLIRLSC